MFAIDEGWRRRIPRRRRVHRRGKTTAVLSDAGRETCDQLPSPDDVEQHDRQGGKHDGGEHGGNVRGELSLEGPQRQRQHSFVGALGEHQREDEAVPNAQPVVDRDRRERRSRHWVHKCRQRAPVTRAVDAHRLVQFSRNVPDEVGEDDDRQRKRERDRRQDQGDQAVVESRASDHEVDRDDHCLQRNGKPEQEQREGSPQPAGSRASHDGIGRHQRADGRQHNRGERDDHAVEEVHEEVVLQDEDVVVQCRRGWRQQRVLAEEPFLALEAGDHDVVDRDHGEDQPERGGDAGSDIGALPSLGRGPASRDGTSGSYRFGDHQAPSKSLVIFEKPDSFVRPRERASPNATRITARTLATPML